ncbi:hypothetical protein CHS0354_001264 [Potamilus streckersoni]|uniref:Uncharacterized protein n=1 Tax=Potamilus streckersoni TaxID=2493646 RepID=A0AAE0S786_9BIVA|nr:hypothetical protein CHS0354_001264 [Potamilus streckersoni]
MGTKVDDSRIDFINVRVLSIFLQLECACDFISGDKEKHDSETGARTFHKIRLVRQKNEDD